MFLAGHPSQGCFGLQSHCAPCYFFNQASFYPSDFSFTNYVQFWFRRFRSGIFDFKDAPRTGRPVIENVDKITEIIEVDRHELLPHGQTLNSDLCCQQLDRLKLAIDQKWPELANRIGAAFHQDNARTHPSVVTRHNLWELGWEVLMHPPYNPDLAPSDYHLFLELKNFLSDKKLVSRQDCENRLLDVFANTSQDFYERGIMKSPLKWQQIIQQNGVYLTEIGQLEAC
ncbi:histone-lysine N-methyltransferase SETMAR [Trichonephila clavipes]|uniref:Histone-lysine N-methyltransferase SETMAR n=1 Tax=Trichonephila clavipes TaxID=2585209 RepID=A0A8X6VB12_TRICX|nr:histone-lysine N-methyltransferase SETMAR [Trichonephila clavipes]